MKNLELVRNAMDSPSFAETRKLLRNIASTTLKDNAHSIRSALQTHASVWGIRPSWSSLRDAMSIETLVGVATGQISAADIDDALRDPRTCGIPKAKAKSGYDIGRPSTFDDAAYAATITASKSGATMTSTSLSLDTMMGIIDHVVFHHKHPLTLIRETLVDHLGHDADLVSGACDALRLRGEVSEPPYILREHREIAKRVHEIISDTPADTPEPEPVVSGYAVPDATKAQLIDLTLGQAGLPNIATLLSEINAATKRATDAEARAKASVMAAPVASAEVEHDGTIPSGKVRVRKAYEVFGITKGKELLDFDVPVWEWDGVHPHVPDMDENYIFRPFELFRVLYAIITNQRAYLHGHTGTGKTTLVEQVAARLYWPVMRVNFDSEITRMDLIGRDVLTSEGGVTSSEFVDGILPQMMSGPYIGIFDEIDFVRPDVAYVMQRALEGNGLMLTEDGGRIVKPHKMFRMFATGNTVGQGDEHGMYQGARPQSMALLDRFTVWVKVDYMSAGDRAKLIKATAPTLTTSVITQINQYVGEHLEAFTKSNVLQPISPRTYMAFAKAVEMFTAIYPEAKHKDAVTQAVETTILDRASVQDRAVLMGIAQRVFS